MTNGETDAAMLQDAYARDWIADAARMRFWPD